MPIVFEQPGPLDASAAGAGAAQFSRDLPAIVGQQRTLAGLYEAMARAHGGGHGAGVVPHFLGNIAGGGPGNIIYNPPSSDPLTQAENLRLQRLQNARSLIQQQIADGSLTAEEGNNLLIQAQTGIDPLRQQQERAQAKIQNEQLQQMQHLRAMQTSMENMDAQARATHMQSRVAPLYDPVTQEYLGTFFMDNRNGVIQQVREPRPEQQRGQMNDQLRNTIRHQVEQSVYGDVRHYRGSTVLPADRPEWTQSPEGIQQEISRRERARLASVGQGGGQGGGQAGSQPVDARTAVDAVVGRVQQQMGMSQATDPGMVQGEARPSETEGMGVPGGSAPSLQGYLRSQPRGESPNEPSDVTLQQIREVGPRVIQAYNNTSQFDRRFGRQTRALGLMAEMLENANVRGRGLTRHELAAYRRLQRSLSGFAEQASFALE